MQFGLSRYSLIQHHSFSVDFSVIDPLWHKGVTIAIVVVKEGVLAIILISIIFVDVIFVAAVVIVSAVIMKYQA